MSELLTCDKDLPDVGCSKNLRKKPFPAASAAHDSILTSYFFVCFVCFSRRHFPYAACGGSPLTTASVLPAMLSRHSRQMSGYFDEEAITRLYLEAVRGAGPEVLMAFRSEALGLYLAPSAESVLDVRRVWCPDTVKLALCSSLTVVPEAEMVAACKGCKMACGTYT